MQPFLDVIFSLTILVVQTSSPGVEQTVTRLSFAALASTGQNQNAAQVSATLTRAEERSCRERRKIPGASTMQEAPCNARTVRRPVMQNSASKLERCAAHRDGRARVPAPAPAGKKRQICTPGIPWPQRPVPEPCLNKYSFSIFLTTCFSGFEIGFTYADRGTREKAGDKRLLPSAVLLLGQRRAQFAASRQSVIVRSLVADHAVTGQIGAVVVAAGLPADASIRHRPSRRSRTGRYSSRSACPRRR